ncbi:hypothetical protein N9449_07340 [Oceanospirillaceae bacterium]|nr:hypothetical protein [Oceanospirillaceae bacterium]
MAVGAVGIKKSTTEEVKRIDIRYMRKRGLLKPSTQGSLRWTCRGEPSGDIRYTCSQNQLKLNYRHREHGGEWQSVEQHIPFDRTPCHYGGERLWFLCPRCRKRVAVLYGADVLFLCRHCYQLPYASQNQGYLDKLIDQKHKLGERIFQVYESGDGWGKKKGMHWSTFDRLYRKYKALDQAWCIGVARCFPSFTDFDI